MSSPNADQPNSETPIEEISDECGFCLFIKETYTEWEKCMEEGEKNGELGKCDQVMANLKKFMEEHPDHYAPLLEVEKAAEAEAAKQLEEESDGSKQLEKKSS